MSEHIYKETQEFKSTLDISVRNLLENINDSNIEKNIYNTIDELHQILTKKDNYILELQQKFKKQKDVICYQEEVLKNQIYEIHQLKEQKLKEGFYKPHPKDEYTIEFGNKAWRGATFRYAIATRGGKSICNWVLNKTKSKSKKIQEFKQYLEDINYQL